MGMRYMYTAKKLEAIHKFQVASPLTTLFTQMVACIGSKDSLIAEQCKVWLNITTLCVKCFHSLSSQDLPEYFEVTSDSDLFSDHLFNARVHLFQVFG